MVLEKELVSNVFVLTIKPRPQAAFFDKIRFFGNLAFMKEDSSRGHFDSAIIADIFVPFLLFEREVIPEFLEEGIGHLALQLTC